MKRVLFLAVLGIAILSSCSRGKQYTINGSFDIPMEISLGDTVIQRDLFDGGYVYMLNMDGSPIDSALIENEQFVFEGKIKEKDACFVCIAYEFIQGVIALEPGEINLSIGDAVIAYGTPTNDVINDVDARIDELAQSFSDDIMALAEGDDVIPSDSLLMPYYVEFNEKSEKLLDSLYQQNKNSLIGVYIVNIKTASAQSVEELDTMLKDYDEYISESDVMNARRQYLYEKAAYGQEDFGY